MPRGALIVVLLLAGGLMAAQSGAQEPPAPPPTTTQPPTEPVPEAPRPEPEPDPNPCAGPKAASLRCPDLVMRRPWGLYTDRLTKAGAVVLRAGNSIDNIGRGPAELHGRRISPRFMKARQRIYRRGGGRIAVDTGARLQFKFAHQSRYWWKLYRAARFELWRLDAKGKRRQLVRTGPKVAYCLRDLVRTRPRESGSPRRPVYPPCSNDGRRQRVTLGTSVGWSDVYPPAYSEQWIDVTGLRGCFAYVHIADPGNAIWEVDEDNNWSQQIVRLPYVNGKPRRGCPGRNRGRVYDNTKPLPLDYPSRPRIPDGY